MKRKRNPKKPLSWWLYVLKCEQGRWYVGITTDVGYKYRQHQRGFATAWTRKYKPVELFYKKDLGDATTKQAQIFEGRVMRAYMEKYGYEKVRCDDVTQADIQLRRFDKFFTKYDWETFVLILFLIITASILLIERYNEHQTAKMPAQPAGIYTEN